MRRSVAVIAAILAILLIIASMIIAIVFGTKEGLVFMLIGTVVLFVYTMIIIVLGS